MNIDREEIQIQLILDILPFNLKSVRKKRFFEK